MTARRSRKGKLRDGTSRAELAYSKLKAEIHDGRYQPGQRMHETDLATALGMSRTPIRDALQRLETEGMLISAPRRGLVVADLNQEQVSELYSIRGVLEAHAARHAAQHASPAEINALHELLERQSRTRDVPGLDRLNQLFHEVISRAARNRYLVNVLDSFQSSLAVLPGSTYAAPGRTEAALEEHAGLVDAIERRDGDAAERIMRRHMAAAERIRMVMIAGADLEHLALPPAGARGRPPSRTTRRRA